MNRILLIGNRGAGTSASTGSGACIARTERFRKALESGGFNVTVCSPEEGMPGAVQIRKTVAAERFSCAVAISPFPAESAVLSRMDLPMWIDMNGMHPAELQMQDRSDPRYGERLYRILALENMLLGRGDGFSAPSRRQSAAVTAELLLLGRTDFSHDTGIQVSPIPHSAAPFMETPDRYGDEFRIISTGSFNIWFDEEVLFKALEYAMDSRSDIRFTATGGAIPFSPDKFPRFVEAVDSSSFRERFSLPGWVTRQELDKIYLQGDAATYTDIPSPETCLGARTRALDWISRGIPVVCTRGAEISQDIERHGLGIVVPSGDWKALGDSYLKLASDPELRGRIRGAQRDWCSGTAASENVFKPLLQWCVRPVRVTSPALGRPTVPGVNSASYLAGLFRILGRSAGYGYSMKRMLKRLGLVRKT